MGETRPPATCLLLGEEEWRYGYYFLQLYVLKYTLEILLLVIYSATIILIAIKCLLKEELFFGNYKGKMIFLLLSLPVLQMGLLK